MSVLELVCVRHGTTALNVQRIVQGQAHDVPLSPLGEAQVARLGAALAHETFEYVASSDLRRAVQTAEAIVAPERIRLDCDLREFDFGEWEGLTWDEIAARYPAESAAFERSYTQLAPPGGERFDEVLARVERAVDRVITMLGGAGRALLVTHAGPLHVLRYSLLRGEADAAGAHFSPAGVTRYRIRHGAVEVVMLDDTSHIAEVPS